jgi:hypothetical protein
LKSAFVVAQRFAFPIGSFSLQLKASSGDRAMLHVVDDSAHGAENAGECRAGKTNGYEKQKYVIAKTEKSLHGEGVFSKLELAARRWADRLEGKKRRGRPQRAAATKSRNTDQVSRGMIWEEEREARRRETTRLLQTLKMFEYSREAA